jgi:3-carboxy-cis,cis-muconate cycloisomerase
LSPDSKSLPAEGSLFGLVLTTDALAAATSDRAWIRAMLDFEAALAGAEAGAGVIPPEAAEAVRRCCSGDVELDAAQLGREGRLTGNPAVALVASLRRCLPEDVAQWVHFGATSQDVVDTALMLVLRPVLDLVLGDLARAADAAASLAERFRSTPMVARTLLQHARPTTFGRKAAGWMVALDEVAGTLSHIRRHRLAVQLGGPEGTLADLGEHGPRVVDDLASDLGLAVPVMSWHTDRTRVAEAAGALALAAGAAGKIALDVCLLMQNEVGEAFEPAAAGRGGSSSMAHKRNPAMSAAVIAAWKRAQGLSAILLGAVAQEHERAAGAWQAEALTFSELCQAAGGAVSVAADILSGLEVVPDRMAHNLALSLGPARGHEMPPTGASAPSWLGSAEALVDRALALHRKAYLGA